MGVKVEKNDLRKRKLFLEGNILQGVLSVCVPMAAFQLMNEIFRVFDLAITARINPESVTAVSFYNQLGNSIASFAMGLSMGAGILIAGYYGAGEYEKVKKTVNTTFFLAGSAGVILAVLLIAAGRPILRLANTPDELIRIGWDYYRLVMLNLILVFFNNVYIAIEKARGNGSRILAVNLLMAASKFAISWFLVVIMGKGIVAVAVSTLAANLFVSCTGLYFLRDPEDAFGLSPGYITLCPAFLHKIFHISLPIMAEKFAFSAGKVMVNSVGVEYGTQTVGALGVSNSISALSTVPAGSIGDGGAAIIRQNIGVGNKERALKVFGTVFATDMVCGVFGFATTLLFLNPILEIFSGGDSGFSQLIRQIFVLEMLSNIFLSVHAAMMALFYAFGYTRLSFVLNFSRLFVFRLPVLLFFLYCTDLTGGTAMGLVMMISNGLTGIFALVLGVIILHREYGAGWIRLLFGRKV